MNRKCFFKMFSKLSFALSTRFYLYVILMSLSLDIKIVVVVIVFVIVDIESLIRTTTTINKQIFISKNFFLRKKSIDLNMYMFSILIRSIVNVK